MTPRFLVDNDLLNMFITFSHSFPANTCGLFGSSRITKLASPPIADVPIVFVVLKDIGLNVAAITFAKRITYWTKG